MVNGFLFLLVVFLYPSFSVLRVVIINAPHSNKVKTKPFEETVVIKENKLLATYVAKNEALTIVFAPAINYVIYSIAEELKKEGLLEAIKIR